MKCFNTILSICLLLSVYTKGQELNTFNINIYNGLPDNKAYRVIVDYHGYLWICTPQGVVRYNGYEFKSIGLLDGLPNDDVWNIFEDKKGRLWLSSFSKTIGFIYNNKYHNAYKTGNSFTLYPASFFSHDSGITFFSTEPDNKVVHLFVSTNDTLCEYHTSASNVTSCRAFVSEDKLLELTDNKLSFFTPNYQDKNDHQLQFKRSYPVDDTLLQYSSDFSKGILLNDNIIYYKTEGNLSSFAMFSFTSGKTSVIDINKQFGINEFIEYIYPDEKSHLYLITTHHIMKFDKDISFIKSFDIDSLIPKYSPYLKLNLFLEDSLWNNCIGSLSNGIWINYRTANKFKKVNIDLAGFKYLGGIKDSVNFWWCNTTSTMAIFKKNEKVRRVVIKQLRREKISDITHFGNDTFILSAPLPKFYFYSTNHVVNVKQETGSIHNYISDNNGGFMVVSTFGFYRFRFSGDHKIECFSKERYDHLAFDSLRNSFWAYSNNNLCVHTGNDNLKIEGDGLKNLGVIRIEKVVFDNKYGNIFLKGYNNVCMFDPERKTFTNLFANYNLKSATIYVYNNLLIVAGRFGILFNKITDKDSILQPVAYPNIKDINYRDIYDCQIAYGKLLLNTDKGTFEVTIPNDSLLTHPPSVADLHRYRFIVCYSDSFLTFKSNDTLILNQHDKSLQFDIISPYGNGKVKYSYSFNGGNWMEINSNEWVLPATCSPGKYYILTIVAYDNVWKSKEIILHLYVQPFWWQTHNAHKIILLLTILLLLLLIITVALITRRVMLDLTKRRNMHTELEIKAIYAQINPHFIFNSLNAALLLVRKNRLNDAYKHISQFSRLLRSYIRSSRNKFISIADEVANLTDYLELQSTRFAHKFEFTISIDDTIDAKNTKIPALLLQPFVENALNHGLLAKKEEGRLKIVFKIGADKNEVICFIDDDGIGRKRSMQQNKDLSEKNESYGDLLIKDLIRIFNKYEAMNIEIKYFDKEKPLSGTIVMVHIKNPRYD